MIKQSAERLERLQLLEDNNCAEIEEGEFWEDDPMKITDNPLERLLSADQKDEDKSQEVCKPVKEKSNSEFLVETI